MQDGGIQRGDGVCRRDLLRKLLAKRQVPPLTICEHAHAPGFLRGDGCIRRLDREARFANALDQLIGTEAAAVFDHAVIGQDGELACWEQHGEEVVERLASGVGARRFRLFAHLPGNFDSACGSMMAICDVGAGDVLEHGRDGLDRV